MKILYPLLAMTCLFMSNPLSAEESPQPLFVAGSTSVSKLIEATSEPFSQRFGNEIYSRPLGSTKGVIAISNGVSEIGLISRYLTEQEIRQNPTIQQITIDQDAIVMLVHSSNPLVNITSIQVQDVYAGNITEWRDLMEGLPGKIHPLAKAMGHGTLDSFNSYFDLDVTQVAGIPKLKFKKVGINHPFNPIGFPVYDQINQAVGSVSRTPDSLAFESLGALTVLMLADEFGKVGNVKSLALDGVLPIENGTLNVQYPLRRPLNLLLPLYSSETAKNYVKFILSKEGQQLLSQFNYIPMPDAHIKNTVIR